MATPSVLVTQRIPAPGIERLAEVFAVDYHDEEQPLAPAELAARAYGKDALVPLLTDRIDEALLAQLPGLRVVANVAVGYDNIDLAAARDRGIVVTNTPGVLTDATADLAMALVLATARRIVEADRFVREGRFHGWGMMMLLGGDLAGATFGVAGFGRIGQAVAARARGFGMRVIYSDEQRASAEAEAASEARYVDKATLLAQSDVLSLHLPLTPQTRHFIGAPELAAMKKTAYLVNTARGPVIDERALAHALAAGTIAGAGLDVFENEPAVTPELLALPNVVLVPHIGSATNGTRRRMALMAAENAIAVVTGGEPPNRVA